MKKENVRTWGWIVALVYTVFMLTAGDVNAVNEPEVELTKEEVREKEKQEGLMYYASVVDVYDKDRRVVTRADKNTDYKTEGQDVDGVILIGEKDTDGIYVDISYRLTPKDDTVSLDDINIEDNIFINADVWGYVSIVREEVIEVNNDIITVRAVVKPSSKMGDFSIETAEFRLQSRDNSIEYIENEEDEYMFANNINGDFKKTYEFEEWVW